MKLSDIDPVKCPTLHRAIKRMEERGTSCGGWAKVVELRRTGEQDAADRIVRRLLGVQGPPMTEETKDKLRRYTEEHKEEIKARHKQERDARKRTIALLQTKRKRSRG